MSWENILKNKRDSDRLDKLYKFVNDLKRIQGKSGPNAFGEITEEVKEFTKALEITITSGEKLYKQKVLEYRENTGKIYTHRASTMTGYTE